MSHNSSPASRSYLHEFFEQVEYLNEATIFIWLCGTLFTRVAAGVWLGSRPAVVLLTILTMVYLYMHRGRYHTMLIRFPIVILLLFLGQTYIIHSGKFFSAQPLEFSWKQFALAWGVMNFSYLFHGEEPAGAIAGTWLRMFRKRIESKNNKAKLGKLIPLHKLRSLA